MEGKAQEMNFTKLITNKERMVSVQNREPPYIYILEKCWRNEKKSNC